MVNLTDFERMFFTPRELRDIESRAAAYDREQELELRQETVSLRSQNVHDDLRQSSEKDNREHLAFLNEDIGTLLKVRERLPGSSAIRQMTEHLIRVRQAEIESIVGEIHESRAAAKTKRL